MGKTETEARAWAAFINEQPKTSARATDLLRWAAAGDNYEPTRTFCVGFLVEYTSHVDGSTCYRLTTDERSFRVMSDAANGAVFILDDSTAVRVFYSGGYNLTPDPETSGSATPYTLLMPFPTSGQLRPDNGEPVDFSNWQLGPRKCWHLKVRRLGL